MHKKRMGLIRQIACKCFILQSRLTFDLTGWAYFHAAVRTANSQPLFSEEDIHKATTDGVRKYFINYSVPSGDADDKMTDKKYTGEW